MWFKLILNCIWGKDAIGNCIKNCFEKEMWLIMFLKENAIKI